MGAAVRNGGRGVRRSGSGRGRRDMRLWKSQVFSSKCQMGVLTNRFTVNFI